MHPTDFLAPKSIAIIGASQDPEKIGAQLVINLMKDGFSGEIYPINPHSDTIQGLKSYKSVLEITNDIDMALIAVPAGIVPKIVDECGQKGIPTVVIISAGFREIGQEGEILEKRVATIANNHGIKIIGPNCLGIINTEINLNATFSASSAEKGNVILFSQSGAFGTAILDWASSVNLGFKYFISLGNKANISEIDLIERWTKEFENSTENIVFAGYLEEIQDGKRFIDLVSQITKRFPVIILKPGRSKLANKAISSHTGAMASEDAIVRTALDQAGCIQVDSIEEMFDLIQVLSRQSIPRGNKVAIVTNAGGPGVTITDTIEESILEMAELSETTKFALSQKLPVEASISNPIDVIGDAKADRYEKAIESAIIDENVDMLLVLLTPQAITEVEKTAGVITEKYRKYSSKPVIASFIGGDLTEKGLDILNQNQMPIFRYPGDAVRAMGNAYRYKMILDRKEYSNNISNINVKRKTKLPDRKNITGEEAELFVESYGIPIVPSISIGPNKNAPDDVNSKLGYPVVAKLSAPNLLHKTELDAIEPNIRNKQDLEFAITKLNNTWYHNFFNNTGYKIQIQKMVQDGMDLIIGMKRDASFGPVILFGMGGILTELLNDNSRRIAPVNFDQAIGMIQQTKVYTILKGYRNQPAKDLESIAYSVQNLSQIALAYPEIQEIDINPFIVLNEGDGGFAVDVKIVTDQES